MMDRQKIVEVARLMISRHGLTAQAMAMARVRAHGTSEEAEEWRQVHSAICELRRTALQAGSLH